MNRTGRSAARGIVAYVRRNPGCSRTSVINAGFPYTALQKAIGNGLIRADRASLRSAYRLYPAEQQGPGPS